MEFLNDNIGIITLVLGLAVLIILVRLVMQSNSLTKNLITKKFSFENLCETDKDSGEKNFVLIIANKTLNDTSITDVGFMLDGQTFSYNAEFRAQNGFTSGDKAVISQRSSIKLCVKLEDFETAIFKFKRSAKIKKLRAYVVDSSGFMTSAPVKRVQRVVKEDYHAMLNALRIMRIEKAKQEGVRPAFSDKIKGLFVRKKSKRTPPVIIYNDNLIQTIDKEEVALEVSDSECQVEEIQQDENN